MGENERSGEVERLLSVQRAARALANSADDWWRELTEEAEATVSAAALDAFYLRALLAMQRILGADEVSILLADAEGGALVSRASIGLGEEGTVQLRIPAGQGMAGRVLAARQPLIVPDLSAINLVSPVLQQQGLQSVVAVPLLTAHGRTLGVLHAGSRRLAHFTESDAELLSFLAERVVVVVERVRLFEEQRHIARVSRFLAETGRIMAAASDLASTLDELARAALPLIGDLCLIDMMSEEGVLRRVVARHADSAKQPLADRLRDEYPPSAEGSHPAAEVLKLGGTRWSLTMSDDFLRSTTLDADHYELTRLLGFRSYIVVPITDGAEPIGALTLVSCSRPFTEDDVALAEGLAQQVSSVVAKAQKLEDVSRTSRMLQEALLPSDLPTIEGLAIHTSYSAASHALDVGGDFYDVFRVPGGTVWLMIGDVEGHDQRAAAEMGQLRSAARTLAVSGKHPSQVLDDLRAAWEHIGFTRTATVAVGSLDATTGALVIASAGHPPPIVVTSNGADLLDLPRNPLLGVPSPHPTRALVTSLSQADVLLLYTDGALNERTLGFDEGVAWLCKAAEVAAPSPRAVCERIVDRLLRRPDDAALLAVMRH